jgi:hypothetical protein
MKQSVAHDSLLIAQAQLNPLLKLGGLLPRMPLDPEFKNLTHLDPANRSFVKNSLQLLTDCLQAGEEQGRELKDTRFMMEYTFRRLSLSISEEFMSTLNSNDLVEGYDLDKRQIFRNFQFMQICGYDLLDLLTHDWVTLYERSQTISNELIRRCQIVCTTGETMSLDDLPVHYMKERMSGSRQISRVKFRHLGPVFSSPGVPAGVTVSSTAEVIDEDPTRHELRFI